VKEQEIRINKFLSEAGVCSRREADRQILAGHVKVDGVAAKMGDKIKYHQEILFCGKLVERELERILLVVNKPIGVVCTSQQKEKNNIVNFLNYPKRIYSIGRLDKDSSGLLLMTNQGDLVNRIMKASNYHEKEYLVTVNKDITASFLKNMASGVYLPALETKTRPCLISQNGKRCFRIILTQGLNRQIRRMCEALSYRVAELLRIRIMNLELGALTPGTYRNATTKEWSILQQTLAHDNINSKEEDWYGDRFGNRAGQQIKETD
jgi:23S rRNA pseudouridine2604 synthase